MRSKCLTNFLPERRETGTNQRDAKYCLTTGIYSYIDLSEMIEWSSMTDLHISMQWCLYFNIFHTIQNSHKEPLYNHYIFLGRCTGSTDVISHLNFPQVSDLELTAKRVQLNNFLTHIHILVFIYPFSLFRLSL